MDCWSFNFSNNIIKKIVEYTNTITKTKFENYSREREIQEKPRKMKYSLVLGYYTSQQ